MKKSFMLWSLLLLSGYCSAQGFQWAKRAGLWAYDFGYSVAVDNNGNAYVAGKYEKNANFSGITVPNQGNHDIFLAKYDPSGALLWVRTAGGTSGDYALAVATNGNNVFIAGEIQGSAKIIKFVGSSVTLKSKGSNDIFLAKYDLNGNIIWAKRAGYIYFDRALGIDCDNSGNVYVCGGFTDKAVFGESEMITSFGGMDIFLAKYGPSGNFLWVRKAGGEDSDEARDVETDASGNIYICGKFKYSADFNGTGITGKGADIFLAKYSPGGNLIWVRKAGSYGTDGAWDLAIDDAGKIFVTGEFKGAVAFGNNYLSSSGNADIFIARYSSSGYAEWAKKAGGSLIDRGRGIATDGSNIYVTGQFGGKAVFGYSERIAADSSDIFVTQLSNNGHFLWTSTVGGKADKYDDLGYESGESVCADNNGNVYVSGNLLEGGVFGTTTLNDYDHTDIFITKMKNSSKTDEPVVDHNVQLLSFKGEEKSGLFYIDWETKDESYNHYFILERSDDGKNFSRVGVVNAAGYSTGSTGYSFIDCSVPLHEGYEGMFYYRLNFTDYDGKAGFSYSITVPFKNQPGYVSNPGKLNMEIFPNPVNQRFTLSLSGRPQPELLLTMYDLAGKIVNEMYIFDQKSDIDVSSFLPGIYLLALKSGNQLIRKEKIIVQ